MKAAIEIFFSNTRSRMPARKSVGLIHDQNDKRPFQKQEGQIKYFRWTFSSAQRQILGVENKKKGQVHSDTSY